MRLKVHHGGHVSSSVQLRFSYVCYIFLSFLLSFFLSAKHHVEMKTIPPNRTLTCWDLHLKLQWNSRTQMETVTHTLNYTAGAWDHASDIAAPNARVIMVHQVFDAHADRPVGRRAIQETTAVPLKSSVAEQKRNKCIFLSTLIFPFLVKVHQNKLHVTHRLRLIHGRKKVMHTLLHTGIYI